MGVRSFDASFGGLGGCPYASTPGSRAPGNIDMRTLLDAIEARGSTHTVDRHRADEAARIARDIRAGASA